MDNSETVERVSAMEAAGLLGTTRLRVLMLIKEGMLKGTQDGGEWFVERESLDCFKAHGGDVAVQRTCRTSCGGSCSGHGK
jgi:excisionase family DNA binding protein